jgi:hypothetical protein
VRATIREHDHDLCSRDLAEGERRLSGVSTDNELVQVLVHLTVDDDISEKGAYARFSLGLSDQTFEIGDIDSSQQLSHRKNQSRE